MSYLDGGQRGDDGRRAEPVGDHGEVGEVPLDRRVEDLVRAGVAERRAVLVQQVHQLLRNYPAKSGETVMNHERRRTGCQNVGIYNTLRLHNSKIFPFPYSRLHIEATMLQKMIDMTSPVAADDAGPTFCTATAGRSSLRRFSGGTQSTVIILAGLL